MGDEQVNPRADHDWNQVCAGHVNTLTLPFSFQTLIGCYCLLPKLCLVMGCLSCFNLLSNIAFITRSSSLEQYGHVKLSSFTYSTIDVLVESYSLP